jgi:hypothetical protein
MNPALIALCVVLCKIEIPNLKYRGQVDVYENVPAELREELKQAVDSLVAAEKIGDWKAVYALQYNHPTEAESRFISKMKRTRILREFRPWRVVFVPPDSDWTIQGCASFEPDRNDRGHISNIHATWKDSRWYVSAIAFVPVGDEKKAAIQECSLR